VIEDFRDILMGEGEWLVGLMEDGEEAAKSPPDQLT
jgi:hypothetical protein